MEASPVQMPETADRLVSAYINIRNAIQEKEDEIKSLKETQDQMAEALLELCKEQNIDSIRTPFGTASRSVRTHYWTNDWHEMYEFIREHDAIHLLEKRLHNTNMKEFLEENPDVVPVGLQADRKYVMTVRKPTAK
jgi:site-specific DNA-adenine methylase